MKILATSAIPNAVLEGLEQRAQVIALRAALALDRATQDLSAELGINDDGIYRHFKTVERDTLDSLKTQWLIEHGVPGKPETPDPQFVNAFDRFMAQKRRERAEREEAIRWAGHDFDSAFKNAL